LDLRDRVRCALLAAAVAAVVPAAALAHRLAPALLELFERGEGRVEIRFKIPVEQPEGSRLEPVLPAGCVAEGAPEATPEGTGVVLHWFARCGAAGLLGSQVSVKGLASSGTNALLRIELEDGRRYRTVLHAGAPSFLVPERESRLDVAHGYARLGVEHILTGFDHLLFVFGLVLLVQGGRALLATVTAFTLGHSVTLSLAALGFVHFPSAWIEVLIAGTILWLAAELALPPDPSRLMRRKPWLMAGAFGLLHGLGFAGALAEVGLPQGEIPLALLAFNVGIEVGQLAFVVLVLAALWLLRRGPLSHAPGWLARAPVTAMGALAAYWCFERSAAALGL
jgi:hydrogenase/urease accessory protein HupE